MARTKIGAVVKSKDPGRSNYIKIDLYNTDTITLKNGQYINVESKAFQLNAIREAVAAGRMSEENGEKALARAEKIPDFVLGELVVTD